MGEVEVRIDLPLPMDVTGALMDAVGKVWPGAMLRPHSGRGVWLGEHKLVMVIPDEARKPKPLGVRAAKAARDAHAGDDGMLGAFEETGPVLLPPEDLAKTIALSVHTAIEEHPDEVPNYLEWRVHHPPSGREYVVYGCLSKEQTPHALRAQAEERASALFDECARLRDELARAQHEIRMYQARA